MTDRAKKIKEKLDVVSVSREDWNTLCEDRLKFGFDSIYFRYVEIVEELSWFKEQEARKANRIFDRKSWCTTKKMYFYECLKQLLHIHDEQENDE